MEWHKTTFDLKVSWVREQKFERKSICTRWSTGTQPLIIRIYILAKKNYFSCEEPADYSKKRVRSHEVINWIVLRQLLRQLMTNNRYSVLLLNRPSTNMFLFSRSVYSLLQSLSFIFLLDLPAFFLNLPTRSLDTPRRNCTWQWSLEKQVRFY